MERSVSWSVSEFAHLRFKHRWRPYQGRVLAELGQHLEDRRLHIVAPPGSGKTVLGLEVVRRLAHASLILVPTLTIREQWLVRATTDFVARELGKGREGVSVSTELDSPATVTVVTYQALHLAHRNGGLGAALNARGIATLVVDEAHHLRRSWWESLEGLSVELEETTRVALTATPPYDVSQREWNRYLGFCGPIDVEIGVPELVRAKNLCPHQDYVLLSLPTGETALRLERWRAERAELVSDLGLDTELAQAIGACPVIVDPGAHRSEVFAQVEFYLAVVIFLSKVRWEASQPLGEVLGLSKLNLPEMDVAWAEILLEGLLDGRLEVASGLLDGWRRRLARAGALEGRRVRLRTSKRTAKLLIHDIEKRRSVLRIVEHELATRRDSLRLVVLADYIHDRALNQEVEKIGVIPIFQDLRRLQLPALPIAVLTGKVVILPTTLVRRLLERKVDLGQTRQLEVDPLYSLVRPKEAQRHQIVSIVSQLFAEGELRCLVGTAALLGEGWDLPAVNVLVLATVVGSFVSSNQMRGRALRTDPDSPLKVASIWHLASVDQGGLAERTGSWVRSRGEFGGDLERLRRRFEAFLGLSAQGHEISTGFDRLGDFDASDPEAITKWNRRMIRLSSDLQRVRDDWHQSVGGVEGSEDRLIRELRIPSVLLTAKLVVAADASGLGILARIRRWWSGRRLERMARAVAMALVEQQAIRDNGVTVDVSWREGHWSVSLRGARQQAQWRFVSTLTQVFDILANPRYLMLHRRGRYWAVPEGFGKNIGKAKRFSDSWRRLVGRHRLIFVGSNEGKVHLGRAKERALLDYFELRPEAQTRWDRE